MDITLVLVGFAAALGGLIAGVTGALVALVVVLGLILVLSLFVGASS